MLAATRAPRRSVLASETTSRGIGAASKRTLRVTGKDALAVLLRLGYAQIVVRGSHHQMRHPERGGLVCDADAGEYAASVPALPGCFTHEPTVEVATEGFLAALVQLDEEVPVEEPTLVTVAVEVDGKTGALAATG
jgi:predicted RNA binding protein YcfA (HicA-like mRNA interferase family)